MRFSRYKKSDTVEHTIDLNTLEKYHPPHNKSINLVRDNRSFKDNDGYWQVYPIGFSTTQVYVVCPHCGEIHIHGRGEKPEFKYDGYKVAHCFNDTGYKIIPLN